MEWKRSWVAGRLEGWVASRCLFFSRSPRLVELLFFSKAGADEVQDLLLGHLRRDVEIARIREPSKLVMDEDFEVDGLPDPAQAVFDSVRAKLMFKSGVFWARSSIGHELLDRWLDTYQTSRSFRKRGVVELELP
jgi:hypothetical protein